MIGRVDLMCTKYYLYSFIVLKPPTAYTHTHVYTYKLGVVNPMIVKHNDLIYSLRYIHVYIYSINNSYPFSISVINLASSVRGVYVVCVCVCVCAECRREIRTVKRTPPPPPPTARRPSFSVWPLRTRF